MSHTTHFRIFRMMATVLVTTALVWQVSTAAQAARKSPARLTAEQSQAVREISRFFNGFRTLKGEFTQISPRGRVSTGQFYIYKPGRMRFEYSPPNPFVIVSDGTWVAIRNKARDKVDYYPLSSTPLRLVLAKRVDLQKNALIHKVERRDGLVIVTLEDRDKMVPGHLVLVYDAGRKALQQWIVVDGQGRRTTVSLNKLESGVKMDQKLFRVKRPDEDKNGWKKRQNFK